jgi:hypothetical protein
MVKSSDAGQSWGDTMFVSDSSANGIGPDLAVNNSGLHLIRELGLISSNAQEIVYNGSADEGETWYGPTIISDNDSLHSFWPQIAAWGNSNLIVSWTDYRDSPNEWTGDAFISKSTDNGHTWSSPYQLTFFHGVSGTDIAASGDTILISYDDNREGYDAIYADVSFDGGYTWQGDRKVSDSPYYCMESSAAISNGVGHISWADSRISPSPRYFEIFYDRGHLDNTGIEEGNAQTFPSGDLLIASYPNPFNTSTTLTISNTDKADISIFDITGRLVTTLHADQGKAVWKAINIPSGVYFARAETAGKAATAKIILLK